MKVEITKNARRPDRPTVKIDLTNEDAVVLKARGRAQQEDLINRTVLALFPFATGYENVYTRGKRGVSNAGFQALIWVFLP